jgi:hypothetical protein
MKMYVYCMKNVEVEMSRYIKGDRVKFLGQDIVYYITKVEVLPKLTYYEMVDHYGNIKECYQASQIRKVK